MFGISQTVFATMTVVGILCSGILMGVSALRIFKKAPELYLKSKIKFPKPFLIIFSLLGILSSFAFTIIAVLVAPIVGIMTLVLIIATIVYGKMRNHKYSNQQFDFTSEGKGI